MRDAIIVGGSFAGLSAGNFSGRTCVLFATHSDGGTDDDGSGNPAP